MPLRRPSTSRSDDDRNWQAVINGAVLLVVAVAQVLLSRVQAKERERRRGGDVEGGSGHEGAAKLGTGDEAAPDQ